MNNIYRTAKECADFMSSNITKRKNRIYHGSTNPVNIDQWVKIYIIVILNNYKIRYVLNSNVLTNVYQYVT